MSDLQIPRPAHRIKHRADSSLPLAHVQLNSRQHADRSKAASWSEPANARSRQAKALSTQRGPARLQMVIQSSTAATRLHPRTIRLPGRRIVLATGVCLARTRKKCLPQEPGSSLSRSSEAKQTVLGVRRTLTNNVHPFSRPH